MDWSGHAARAEARFRDGETRLPEEPDARQRQLVRMATAGATAGLAHLMDGAADDARAWLRRAADVYRESYAGAPPGSWGRPIGALKARLAARDDAGARADAEWARSLASEGSGSPIGRYAAVLANLVIGDDARAAELARPLAADESFPAPVADSLLALAEGDAEAYRAAAAAVLRSFEERDAYLEDLPVADTVLVLERLAEPRGLAAGLTSPLLPPAGSR